jgi:signal transduction histidine kinase
MLQSPAKSRVAEYLTVGEAAEVLGVSPWTLRNWDKSGKLKPQRHPTNGYRIYRHADLAALLESSDPPRGRRTRLGRQQRPVPQVNWSDIGPREHFVQFYESDEYLIESVAGFIGASLQAGEGAVVIATPEHRGALDRQMRAMGLNVEAARAAGSYVALDAADTLARFMVNGSPDPVAFAQVVGAVVARLARGGRPLRAFGEMVALLWAGGNREAAIRLEQLWNDLAKVHAFALMCAYPMKDLAGDDQGEPFAHVCTCHSRVIPAESYAKLKDNDQQLREIALLQQQALSLKAEIEHRKEVEKALAQAEEERRQRATRELEAVRAEARRKAFFLNAISHDLRTPLNGLALQSCLARASAEVGDSNTLAEALQQIETSVASTRELLDALLEAARDGEMTSQRGFSYFPLEPLLASAIGESQSAAAGKGLALSLAVPQGLHVRCDRVKLERIVLNLLDNAIKFTSEGSVKIEAQRQGRELLIHVIDTGVGIGTEHQAQLFEEFFQVGNPERDRRKGFGLGLSVARRLARQLGGDVSVESTPGRGSRFTVTLPGVICDHN